MSALGHMGIGFAVKPLAPKVPLGILLVATEIIDILWAVFYFTGIDRNTISGSVSPWSHGLFMSLIWSVAASLLGAIIYRNRRSGIIIGLLVFSHWVIDFITHPMGAIFGGKPILPDLPLFFHGSPKVGLGLYNHSFFIAMATDLGMLILGVVIYVISILKKRSARMSGNMNQ